MRDTSLIKTLNIFIMKTVLLSTFAFLTIFLAPNSFQAQTTLSRPYIFDYDSDGNIALNDFLKMLAYYGDADSDGDGVWDSEDLCFDISACNYNASPSEPCESLDALGVCGGDCTGDDDNDGICNDVDTCFGDVDECGICNEPGTTDFIIESITVYYDSIYVDQLASYYVFEIGADTLFTFLCNTTSPVCGDDVAYDGYDYSTVQIGDQCWFSENCRYLPSVTPGDTSSDTDPNYYVYDYNGSDVAEAKETTNYLDYGALYNWSAVMDQNICPTGWHIPSDLEWQTMEISLGMSADDAESDGLRGFPVGSYMKSISGWNGGSNGTNSSGFNALPGGYADSGDFKKTGEKGYWWSSTLADDSSAWLRGLEGGDNDDDGDNYDDGDNDDDDDYNDDDDNDDEYGSVKRDDKDNSHGLSARCVMD